MKKLVFIIFALVILFFNVVSAVEFNISYPEEIDFEEEFVVEVKVIDGSGNYDVKINIVGGGERIAQIYDEKWKSTFYYVNSAVTDSAEFKLKIVKEFDGEAKINAVLRQDKKLAKLDERTINVNYNAEENVDEEEVVSIYYSFHRLYFDQQQHRHFHHHGRALFLVSLSNDEQFRTLLRRLFQLEDYFLEEL